MQSLLRFQLHRVFAVLLGLGLFFTAFLPFLPMQSVDGFGALGGLAGSGFAIAVYALLAYAAMLPMDKPGLRGFSLAGVAVCGASLLYTLYQIWLGDELGGLMGLWGMFGRLKLYGLFAMLSVAFGVSGALLRLRVRTALVRQARNATLGAIGVIVLVVLLVLVADSASVALMRILSFAYILATFGAIGTFYLHEVSKQYAWTPEPYDFEEGADGDAPPPAE